MLRLQHSRKLLRLPLTPLIDVVFILLLFFMLSSTFAQQRQLTMKTQAHPQATAASPQPDPPVALLVDAQQVWQVSGQRYEKQHPSRAALLHAWKAEQTALRVTAINDATVQDLVSTLDTLSQAGLDNVSLTPSRP